MLFVYFKAPFGAFRIHQSVETSITSDFLTHSAAYGFLLGLAGIERHEKKKFSNARIAVGLIGEELPKHESVYQQLHSAIGANAKNVDFERTKGTKPSIRPVVREVLVGLEGYIGLNHSELEQLVTRGINQPENLNCWGIPFFGDNNFFVEKLLIQDNPPICRWFSPFNENSGAMNYDSISLHYLSTWTDYENNDKSKSLLFSLPAQPFVLDIEDKSWTQMF